MNTVNKPFRKKDAMQLVTGQPVYMDDLVPADCLIVKLLRSPHANAIVKSINTAVAKKVPGIEAIFTWEDVPQDARRYTQAGQTYPEASPYDSLVIDRHVRFVGDVVAIVVGKDEKCVEKAMKLIKVEYQVLEPVLSLCEPGAAAMADGRLLWRVLDNLMSNICKYAMPGTRVYLTTEREGDTARMVVRNISRYPLNISADELTERFVRGDSSRSTEGSGLGLSIATSLMSLQGGGFRLTIDGDLFKVTLTLPAAGAEE